MKIKQDLSVIIPCYNEEANLRKGVLKQVAAYLAKQKYDWEVIISDDGSTDKSRELVEGFIKKNKGFRLLKNVHGGKAWAVFCGIKKAGGKYILFTDMDQSTPIGEVAKLLPWTKKGYLVVIGSRGLARKDFPLFRKIGAVVFALMRRVLVLPAIRDTQCGFKLFEGRLAKEIFPLLEVLEKKAVGWAVSSYDVELLCLAKTRGARIKEVVVKWKDKDLSTSKGKNYFTRYLRESKKMFLEILRVKQNKWRGKYN